MNKIHILEVIGSLKIGGAERIALSIIEYIDRSKYQIDYLVYEAVDNEFSQKVLDLGGNIYKLDYSGNPIKMRKRLFDFFSKNKFDIVHTQLMFHNGIVISAARKAKIKKIISHSHSTKDGKDNNSLINFIYKLWMKSIIKKKYVYKVACGAMAGNYLYGKKRFKKNGIVFKNRIDGRLFNYSFEKYKNNRQKYGVDDKTVFVIIGHLVPLKNHLLAFEAFKKYLIEDNNAILYVLGDGPLKENLVDLTKKMDISDKVIFTGNVTNVYDYIITADHLLLPSWYEGFPVTLIEAQASGLHCLVSNTVTKEADFTGLISWCPLNCVDLWTKNMKYKYNRQNYFEKLVDNEYDFSTYSKWLDGFYNKILNG